MAAPIHNREFQGNFSNMNESLHNNWSNEQQMQPHNNLGHPYNHADNHMPLQEQNFPNFSRPPPRPNFPQRFAAPHQLTQGNTPGNRFQCPPPGYQPDFNDRQFPVGGHNNFQFQNAPPDHVPMSNQRFHGPPQSLPRNQYQTMPSAPRHPYNDRQTQSAPNECSGQIALVEPAKMFNKSQRESQQRLEDMQWLETLINKKKRKTLIVNEPTKSISEFQDKTRHMMVLLAKLQKNKQMLETMKNEDSSIWEQKLKEVTKLKCELEDVRSELTSDKTLKTVQQKMKKRRQKRARMKRLKQQHYEEHQMELAAREEKHARINKDMQQITEKQKLKKQEEDMQKEADEILGQVRKKMSESYKSQQLIEGLQKLRALRADRLHRQGVLGMYESQGGSLSRKLMFEAQLTNLTDLLGNQLNTYKAEESALEVLLETEHNETREKEQEKARLKLAEKLRQEQRKMDRMIFGNQKDPQPGDPLFSFRQFYDAATHSLDDLVSIRRDWDMFLVVPETPGALCVPDHFVHPDEPTSDAWASAIQNTDK